MSERPSMIRRRNGMESAAALRGGPIFNVPTPIGRIVLWTTIMWYASLLIPSPTGRGVLYNNLAFVPVEFLARLEAGQALQAVVPLIGHIFLHDPRPSVMFLPSAHLILNMLWLVVFGSGIARRLCVEGSYGADRAFNIGIFLAFYFACGVAGGLTHYGFHHLESIGLVGASGAISGLMGGTLRFALRLFAPMGAEYGRLAPLWARPVLVASALFIGLNGMTGVAGAAGVQEAAQIAWEAHIGGFLFGLIAFPLFDRLAKRPPLPFGLG